MLVKSKENCYETYLVGLLIKAAIVATLNSIGLLALGIDFAINTSRNGAVLNIIPYIGGVIAVYLTHDYCLCNHGFCHLSALSFNVYRYSVY